MPGLSRAALQKAIKVGQVTVNGQAVKPRQTLKTGDQIEMKINQSAAPAPVPDTVPENIAVLYEDKDVVVIDKPAGVEVHAGMVGGQPTITAWFQHKYPTAQNIGEDEGRPGVVHRLDKDTSGVLLLAKNPKALEHLKKEFKNRHAKKEYVALVYGVPLMKKGRITRPIGRTPRNPLRRTIDENGKPAVTEWQLEKRINQPGLTPRRAGSPGAGFALLRLFPFTGRTHQLRVHLHFLGHPIVGDKLYTFKRQRPPEGVYRQLLHAEKLTVTLPTGRRKTFIAPLPDDFARAINS
jgi:23S rRNA pseudouridine1911/1915/1917 synthase